MFFDRAGARRARAADAALLERVLPGGADGAAAESRRALSARLRTGPGHARAARARRARAAPRAAGAAVLREPRRRLGRAARGGRAVGDPRRRRPRARRRRAAGHAVDRGGPARARGRGRWRIVRTARCRPRSRRAVLASCELALAGCRPAEAARRRRSSRAQHEVASVAAGVRAGARPPRLGRRPARPRSYDDHLALATGVGTCERAIELAFKGKDVGLVGAHASPAASRSTATRRSSTWSSAAPSARACGSTPSARAGAGARRTRVRFLGVLRGADRGAVAGRAGAGGRGRPVTLGDGPLLALAARDGDATP